MAEHVELQLVIIYLIFSSLTCALQAFVFSPRVLLAPFMRNTDIDDKM
jgi:F0F1-type ATP synthase membrane subunit a